MILKHKRTDSNVCRVCKESFSTNMLLIEHAKLHEEDPYICKYCDYKTVIFENLSQHIADTHFSDHLYWCEQCDVQFSSSSELYLHFQEHSCDEQYLCQFCEHETNDPEDLHSHVVNEHACKLIELSDKYNNGEHGQYSLLSKITFDKCKNFFVCQVCGFRSRLHTNVNRHVAIEHTKIFPHVCDDCGKGFSSMLEYCKHLNSHLSEGIYLCQYCEYSTGQIEDLKIHLDFKHSADLPHKCSDCLMRFGNERELISHLPVHETTWLFSLTSIMLIWNNKFNSFENVKMILNTTCENCLEQDLFNCQFSWYCCLFSIYLYPKCGIFNAFVVLTTFGDCHRVSCMCSDFVDRKHTLKKL